MTDNNDDVLVKKFFSENRIDVPDDGFSRRVMRRLPDRTRRISRLWTAVCVVVGLLISSETRASRFLCRASTAYSQMSLPAMSSSTILICCCLWQWC